MNNEIFLKSNTVDGGFLQSEHWQKFQESTGKEVLVFDEDNFKLRAFKHSLSIVGNYFFVPRGPIISENILDEELSKSLEQVIDNCEEKKAGWLRIEPQTEADLNKIKESINKKWTVKKSRKNHQPAQTTMLDLTKTEEELLAQMKQKTRYNIRLSEKRGVKIERSKNLAQDIETFYRLAEETAQRDKIVIHSFSYYKKMITEISEEKIRLYLAKYENEIIGAIIVSFFGGTAVYLHGASSDLHRNTMANYLLQWEAIKDAKKFDCEKYDFGGIKISDEGNNSWQGITKFKLGFSRSSNIVDFPGCWDIVIDKRKYFIYRFLQAFKDSIKFKI